jgi:effector-binding domain-containing protein
MKLTEEPEIVKWPETHYIFIEKIGPIPANAPQAWGEAHTFVTAVSAENKIARYMSLYKMGPEVYRAGFALDEPPVDLPKGLTYEKVPGGKYTRFVLTGPYSDLPQASRRAWHVVAEKQIQVRDDFAIENYVSDPRVTPAEQLVTEILIPTA